MTSPNLDHGIDVWSATLEAASATLSQYEKILTPDELLRARRFRFPDVGRRFTVARAALRNLLAHYLQEKPESIELTYRDRGKPALGPRHSRNNLHFNISHSGELALLAFSRRGELGIDVERLREVTNASRLARRFFSCREAAELDEVAAAEKSLAFFRCWTRKEALLKLSGEGLFLGLDTFDVTLLPVDEPRLRAVHGIAETRLRWSLHELRPAESYLGALAHEGEPWPITLRRWEGEGDQR